MTPPFPPPESLSWQKSALSCCKAGAKEASPCEEIRLLNKPTGWNQPSVLHRYSAQKHFKMYTQIHYSRSVSPSEKQINICLENDALLYTLSLLCNSPSSFHSILIPAQFCFSEEWTTRGLQLWTACFLASEKCMCSSRCSCQDK